MIISILLMVWLAIFIIEPKEIIESVLNTSISEVKASTSGEFLYFATISFFSSTIIMTKIFVENSHGHKIERTTHLADASFHI